MKSGIGPAGAIAYTAVLVVGIMTILLLFPLGLAAGLPFARLTDNWTILGVSASALAMFLAGIAVVPLVRALGLFSEIFRQQAVIIWARRVLEFLMLVGIPEPLFSRVVTPLDAQLALKPNPHYFAMAALPLEDAAYFDDSYLNLLAAKGRGATTILVSNGRADLPYFYELHERRAFLVPSDVHCATHDLTGELARW